MSRWLLVSIGLTLAVFAAWFWIAFAKLESLPEIMPIHWDINMEPDQFAPRKDAMLRIFIFPVIMTLLIGLTLILPWLSPKKFRIEPFADTFALVMALVGGLVAYLFSMTFLLSFAPGLFAPRFFVAGFFAFFALLGPPMRNIRQNFWMGVRTPWTIANEEVWRQTHQLAAWLWLGVGTVGFALTLVGIPFWVDLAILLIAALYPVLHSLILYKQMERSGKI